MPWMVVTSSSRYYNPSSEEIPAKITSERERTSKDDDFPNTVRRPLRVGRRAEGRRAFIVWH
jgi:hypothetical protein